MCISVKITENVTWPFKALNACSDRNRCECGWSLITLSRQNYKALLFLFVIPCIRERVLLPASWIRSPFHPEDVTPLLSRRTFAFVSVYGGNAVAKARAEVFILYNASLLRYRHIVKLLFDLLWVVFSYILCALFVQMCR